MNGTDLLSDPYRLESEISAAHAALDQALAIAESGDCWPDDLAQDLRFALSHVEETEKLLNI